MSARTRARGDTRTVKGDDRAVVGASGRPLPGMVLESGAKQIGRILGQYTVGKDVRTTPGGVQFNVSDCKDVSIGAPGDGSK